MFEDKTRVLLVLPQEVLDRARVFAGSATTRFKRPVSLQMVLRALIDEGLKRDGDRAILANVDASSHFMGSVTKNRAGIWAAVIRHDSLSAPEYGTLYFGLAPSRTLNFLLDQKALIGSVK